MRWFVGVIMAAVAVFVGLILYGSLHHDGTTVAIFDPVKHPGTKVAKLEDPGPRACTPGAIKGGILSNLRVSKPEGEDFRPPYTKNELGILASQEIAWLRMHATAPCVKAMAGYAKVSPAEFPGWVQQHLTLKEVGHSGITVQISSFAKKGKIVWGKVQTLPPHELVWYKGAVPALRWSGGNVLRAAPPAKSSAKPKAAKKATAGSKPKIVYYAAQAPAGSRQFGPVQTNHGLVLNKGRFERKLRTDPLFAATAITFSRDGIGFDNGAAERQAHTFAGNGKAWSSAVDAFLKSVKSYSVAYDGSSSYTTRGMVPRGAKMPQLFTARPHHTLGWTLVLHLQNGHTRALRIACGYQPTGNSNSHVKKTITASTANSVKAGTPKMHVSVTLAAKTTTIAFASVVKSAGVGVNASNVMPTHGSSSHSNDSTASGGIPNNGHVTGNGSYDVVPSWTLAV